MFEESAIFTNADSKKIVDAYWFQLISTSLVCTSFVGQCHHNGRLGPKMRNVALSVFPNNTLSCYHIWHQELNQGFATFQLLTQSSTNRVMLLSFIRCLPLKDRGITLSALMTQRANLLTFPPHYPFNAVCQLGKL